MSDELTEADIAALRAVASLTSACNSTGYVTPSRLGERLWGTAHRNPQSYARPGGRALHRLARASLVVQATEWIDGKPWPRWRLTELGQRTARQL